MKTGKWMGMLLLCSVAFGGCANDAAKNTVVELRENELSAPQKTEVVRGDLCVAEYYDAQVGPRVEQLTFEQEGIFGELLVQMGDTVKEGDILATPALESIKDAIENKQKEISNLTRNYNYRKATLENNLEIAKINLESVYKQIETLDSMSSEFTQACAQAGSYDEERKRIELQLKQLKETYDLELPHLQKQLKKLETESEGNMLKAPFDGTVIALAETEYGKYIDVNQFYVALADTTVMYARCPYISTGQLKKMEGFTFWRNGKEYEATWIPMSHEYYMATINDGEDAYIEFQISDPNGELSFGDFGKVKVITETKKDVLMLPESAVQTDGNKYYAYKDVNGEHVRTEVQVGSRGSIYVEITGGLEEGEVVYVQD